MVKVKYDDKKIEFPSEYTEITLRQFDEMSRIFEGEEPELIQWVKVISFLSQTPEGIIEEWPIEEFLAILKNMFVRLPDLTDGPDKITVGEYVFEVPRERVITVRQMAAIDAHMTDEKDRFAKILTHLLSQVSGKETTISERVDLFNNHPVEPFLPTLFNFSIGYLEDMIKDIYKGKRDGDKTTT